MTSQLSLYTFTWSLVIISLCQIYPSYFQCISFSWFNFAIMCRLCCPASPFIHGGDYSWTIDKIIINENYKQICLRYESEVLRAGMWNVHREWTVIDTGWRLIYTSEEIREHGSIYLTTVETIIWGGKGNSTLRHHFVTFYHGSFSPCGKGVFTFALMCEIISQTEESCLSHERITYRREVSRRQVPANYLYKTLNEREKYYVKVN